MAPVDDGEFSLKDLFANRPEDEDGPIKAATGIDFMPRDPNAQTDEVPKKVDGIIPPLPTDDGKQPEPTSGTIFEALDYLSSANKGGLVAALEGRGDDFTPFVDEAVPYAKGTWQGLKKEQKTNVQDLKRALIKHSPTLGFIAKDLPHTEGEFDLADVPNFIRDVALDAATDPFPYGAVLKGAGKVVSGAAQKYGKYLAESAARTRPYTIKDTGVVKQIPIATAKARELGGRLLEGVTPGKGTAISAGGLVGGAMSTSEDNEIDTLSNIAKGAGVMAGVALGGPQLGKLAVQQSDKIADNLAVATKGERFAGMSNARAIKQTSDPKINAVAHQLSQDYIKSVDGVKPKSKIVANRVQSALSSEMVQRREYVRASGAYPTGQKEQSLFHNQLTEKIGQDMTADGTVAKIIGDLNANELRAFEQANEHNKWITEKVNREVFGQASGKYDPVTGKGMAGLPWHVEDLQPLKDIVKMSDELVATHKGGTSGPLMMARNVERGKSTTDLGTEASRAEYNRRLSLNWLTDVEKQARKLIYDYKVAPVTNSNPLVAFVAEHMGKFDALNNFSKFNMLMPSTSWVRNNYPDNLTKAYHQHGLLGAADAATMGAFHKGLYHDIRALNRGDTLTKFKNPHTQDLIRFGLAGDNVYKESIDFADPMAKYFKRPEQIEKEAMAKAGENPLAKAAWAVAKAPFYPFKMVGEKIVMPIGQQMENTAKAVTYIRTLNYIKNNKTLLKEVGGLENAKQVAADVTKQTFFDYGETTEFERMIAKRLIPFYTFYKNNTIYYAKMMENPHALRKLINVQKLTNNVGEEPTEKERLSLQPYLEENKPRMLGKDAMGDQRVMFSPSDSMADAYKLFSPSSSNTMIEKMNPLLKGPAEMLLNHDTFTKDKMKPSTLKDGEKHLFGSGYSHVALKNFIAKMLPEGKITDAVQMAAGVYGTKLDDKDNPVHTNDMSQAIDKWSPYGLNSMWWPKPLVHQAARTAGKIANEKADITEALNNIFNTHQMTNVSEDGMNFHRNLKSDERKDINTRRENLYKARAKEKKEHGIKATE